MRSKSIQFLSVVILSVAMFFVCEANAHAGSLVYVKGKFVPMSVNLGNAVYIPHPLTDFGLRSATEICGDFYLPNTPDLLSSVSPECGKVIKRCIEDIRGSIETTLVSPLRCGNDIRKLLIIENGEDEAYYLKCNSLEPVGLAMNDGKQSAISLKYPEAIQSVCIPSSPDAPLIVNRGEVSPKNKAQAICESLVKTASTSKTKICLDAIESCVSTSEPIVKSVLNKNCIQTGPSTWECAITKLTSIDEEIRTGLNADPVIKACSPEDAATVSTTVPSVGSPLGASGTSTPSEDSGKSSCAMNPLAFGNTWSSALSYLPFFMLMLVFGFKRKGK